MSNDNNLHFISEPLDVEPYVPKNDKNPNDKKTTKLIIAISGILGVLFIGFAILVVTHIICLWHNYVPASCTEPEKCSYCNKTKGEPLGHTWKDATCMAPKTCSRCGEVTGEKADHQWKEATCTEPKTCSDCGKTEGKALGHEFAPSTCTEPKTCTICGETEGEPLGHVSSDWTILREPTCYSEGERQGLCDVCGEDVIEPIGKLEHTPGDWEITLTAGESTRGHRIKKCTVCGELVEAEDYELSEEELIEIYKKECTNFSYDAMARTPDDYKGEKVYFSGTVLQVCEEATSEDEYSTYRVATLNGYDDVVYLRFQNYNSGSRILEDDNITFYGIYEGLYSYESVMGSNVTIPMVKAVYVDLN